MTAYPTPLAQKIMEHASGMPEGYPLQAGGLLQFGKRAAVNRALASLASRGELIRIGRGIYVCPIEGRAGRKIAPFAHPTVMALAEQRGERIVFGCLSAANVLGVTTQNPMRTIYLTSGPSRRLHFGKLEVELRHAPYWQLALGETKAGKAIRAINYFGELWAWEATKKLRRVLGRKDLEELAAFTAPMPAWVARTIKDITHV